MRDASLPAYSVMMSDSSNYFAGVELLHQAQREYPGINGVISTNDNLAIGTLFECQRQGIVVLNKMAIAGFHGHDFARVVHPNWPAYSHPVRKWADCLLARLRGEHRADGQIDVGFTILAGESI